MARALSARGISPARAEVLRRWAALAYAPPTVGGLWHRHAGAQAMSGERRWASWSATVAKVGARAVWRVVLVVEGQRWETTGDAATVKLAAQAAVDALQERVILWAEVRERVARCRLGSLPADWRG